MQTLIKETSKIHIRLFIDNLKIQQKPHFEMRVDVSIVQGLIGKAAGLNVISEKIKAT